MDESQNLLTFLLRQRRSAVALVYRHITLKRWYLQPSHALVINVKEHTVRHNLQETNGNHLYNLCNEKKWDKVREFLDSDSNKSRNYKSFAIEDGVTENVYIRYKACRNGAPNGIIKSFLGIGGKELLMITTKWNTNDIILYSGSTLVIGTLLISKEGISQI